MYRDSLGYLKRSDTELFIGKLHIEHLLAGLFFIFYSFQKYRCCGVRMCIKFYICMYYTLDVVLNVLYYMYIYDVFSCPRGFITRIVHLCMYVYEFSKCDYHKNKYSKKKKEEKPIENAYNHMKPKLPNIVLW